MTRPFMLKSRFKWIESNLLILRRISSTHTIAEAAKEIGCSEPTISKACRDYKISFRKYGDKHHLCSHSDHDVELARSLRDEGLSIKEIAEKMEMTAQFVSRVTNYIERRNDGMTY